MMLKRFSACLCCALLMLTPSLVASAEDEAQAALILTGKVEAKETTTIAAPMGGAVLPFQLKAGDHVDAGDTLFTIDTTKVYAPLDGTVTGIFAQPGDTAAYAQNRYGALCYIEPEESLIIQTTTTTGYDRGRSHTLYIGDEVFLATASNTQTGVGRVISLSGDTFSVEVQDGQIALYDNVSIYYDARLSPESRVGRGDVTRANAIAVTADGAVLRVLVQDGQQVQRGDVLFEMVSGTLDAMVPVDANVLAPHDGIVETVSAQTGQNVAKDQTMATLHTLDVLTLVSSVSEVDLPEVKPGAKVSISFDGLPGRSYAGTIRSVSGTGTVSDNYTEYAVYIDFTPDDEVRLGMSGTAYPE